MFARVITATAAPGFDLLGLAEQQLTGARERPGYSGYTVLSDSSSGRSLVISLWDTQEHMDAVTQTADSAGISSEGVPASALAGMRLETYEVVLQA